MSSQHTLPVTDLSLIEIPPDLWGRRSSDLHLHHQPLAESQVLGDESLQEDRGGTVFLDDHVGETLRGASLVLRLAPVLTPVMVRALQHRTVKLTHTPETGYLRYGEAGPVPQDLDLDVVP